MGRDGMKIHEQLPVWEIEKDVEKKWFWFKGTLLVHQYSSDTERAYPINEPALVYCRHSAEWDDIVMEIGGSLLIVACEKFWGEWYGPLDYDKLVSLYDHQSSAPPPDDVRQLLEKMVRAHTALYVPRPENSPWDGADADKVQDWLDSLPESPEPDWSQAPQTGE